jgi:hypothetical protein
MKKIVLMILVIGMTFPLLAQKTQELFEQLTEKYAEKDGFSASMLTSDMFELYMKKKNVDESSEVANALKNLDNILVVSQSNFGGERWFVGMYNEQAGKTERSSKKGESDEAKLIHKEIINFYKTNGYVLLKTEKQMGEDIKVYLKKGQSKIIALALITNSSVSTNLVELNGSDIDLSNVASLSKTMNLRGLENLYKIDNSSPYYGRYPSIGFSSESYERYEDMVLRERERARERHTELSEEQLQKIEQQAQLQAQKQMEMAEKYRQMAEQYGRQPIFLSTPGDTNTVYYVNGKKVKSDMVKETLKSGEIKQISTTKDEEEGKTVIRIKTK